MIEHNLGVSTYQSFALKRLDKNFFTKDGVWLSRHGEIASTLGFPQG
jgi:hypothetical protein